MARKHRFLVTVEVGNTPSPIVEDNREFIADVLRRHIHGVRVSIIRRNERIVPFIVVGPTKPKRKKR